MDIPPPSMGEGEGGGGQEESLLGPPPFIPSHRETVSQLLFCHPELVSGSHNYSILLDAENKFGMTSSTVSLLLHSLRRQGRSFRVIHKFDIFRRQKPISLASFLLFFNFYSSIQHFNRKSARELSFSTKIFLDRQCIREYFLTVYPQIESK